MKTAHRRYSIELKPALIAASALLALATPGALAQVHVGTTPLTAGAGTTGLTFLPGTNVAASATLTPSTFTGSYLGDFPCLLTNTNFNGSKYTAFTVQQGYIPFTVSSLPVRFSNAALSANFKLAATGGNGVAGGGDPYTSLTLTASVHQVTSNILLPSVDPMIPASDVSGFFEQDGNGINIVDTVLPSAADYILTPGAYYIFIQARLDASFSPTPAPNRGVTLEFGGNLTSSAYTGFNYTFDWRTVPTPGAGALLALSGLTVAGRRRR